MSVMNAKKSVSSGQCLLCSSVPPVRKRTFWSSVGQTSDAEFLSIQSAHIDP